MKLPAIEGFCGCLLPKGNRWNPSHQSVGGDTLQVEQAAVEKQQQDNVLTEDEAPTAFPNHWNVLKTWTQAAAGISITTGEATSTFRLATFQMNKLSN